MWTLEITLKEDGRERPVSLLISSKVLAALGMAYWGDDPRPEAEEVDRMAATLLDQFPALQLSQKTIEELESSRSTYFHPCKGFQFGKVSGSDDSAYVTVVYEKDPDFRLLPLHVFQLPRPELLRFARQVLEALAPEALAEEIERLSPLLGDLLNTPSDTPSQTGEKNSNG